METSSPSWSWRPRVWRPAFPGCGGSPGQQVTEVKYTPIYNPPTGHPLKDVTLENESENMEKIRQVTGMPAPKKR